MKRHLLATSLAATLLLSTLGCSKKEDAKPTTNTGSYKINGQLKTCQVATQASLTANTQNYLSVQLTTTPQPANGSEVLHVDFMKNESAPFSAYHVQAIWLFHNGMASLLFSNEAATLTSTSSGLSGTFSSVGNYTYPSGSGAPLPDITDGIFTNVQP